MMKDLIIGSNSFSGQDFVDILLEDPEREVIGISRSREKENFLLKYKSHRNASAFQFRQFDLNLNMTEFLEFLEFERPRRIINFAAQSEVGPSWDHPEHWFQTNCVALARLIKYLSSCDYLDRYLHISSPEVYGSCDQNIKEAAPMNPSTPYATSKAAADMLLANFMANKTLPLLTVRATNVYGARQQLFKIMMRAAIYIRLGRRIPLHGGGKAIKSYIHIRDVSRGELAVLENGNLGEIYHLSPDRGASIRTIVELISNRMGEAIEDVVEDVEDRVGQDAIYEINSSKSRKELGWQPEVDLETGINEVVDWIDKHWSKIRALPHEYLHRT